MSPCATIEPELVQISTPQEPVIPELITPPLDWDDIPTILHHIIAYHRIFALVGGSAQAGIFLSQAYYWTPRTKDPEGWFYKTKEEWELETGLTRRQQDTVVRHLKELGLLSVELRGIPCKLYYKINKEAFSAAIGRHEPKPEKTAETTQNQQLHKNAKLVAQNSQTSCTETPNKLHNSAELNKPQTHTQQAFQQPPETTVETTAENTQISAPPSGAPEPHPCVFVNSNSYEESPKPGNQSTNQTQVAEELPVKVDEQNKIPSSEQLPHENNNSAPSSLNRNNRNNYESPNVNKSTQTNQWEPTHNPELKQKFLEWKAQSYLVSNGDKDFASGFSFARNWAKKNPSDANTDFRVFVARYEAEQQRNKEQEEYLEKHRDYRKLYNDRQKAEAEAKAKGETLAPPPRNPYVQEALDKLNARLGRKF